MGTTGELFLEPSKEQGPGSGRESVLLVLLLKSVSSSWFSQDQKEGVFFG